VNILARRRSGGIWVVTDGGLGDSGKGKIVDHLTEDDNVSAVVRYNGGGNAGHTNVVDGITVATHLVPSGIIRSKVRKIMNVLGRGTVIIPSGLKAEIAELEKLGIPVTLENFLISAGAHLTLPHYRALEAAIEASKDKRGTTLKAISQTYGFGRMYLGIRAGDVFYPDSINERIDTTLAFVNAILQTVYGHSTVSRDAVMAEVDLFRSEFSEFIGDEAIYLNDVVDQGGIVLCESAQSLFLDVDNGIYPYSTASTTWPAGIQGGCGLEPRDITRHILVVKAYPTRVGGGKFVTYMGDELSGVIGARGKEFGATTGRPRKCGWPDGVMGKTVQRCRVDEIAVTKSDILTGVNPILYCTGYACNGSELTTLPITEGELANCTPIYQQLSGWDSDITGKTSWDDLPLAAQSFIEHLGNMYGAPVTMIGTGPGREEIIVRKNLIPALD
jgi:adenylosuccinate synthase